jgi:hypothetical protein
MFPSVAQKLALLHSWGIFDITMTLFSFAAEVLTDVYVSFIH